MALGAVGVLLSVLGGWWSVQLATTAGDYATEAVSGVSGALGRVADSLGSAAEAGTSEIASERLSAVDAGLGNAADSVESLSSNPLISLLPVDLEALQISVGQVRVEDAAVQAGADTDAVLDEVASGVAAAAERLDEFSASLRRWVRFAALLFILMAVWSVWAQYTTSSDGVGVPGGPTLLRGEV